MQRDSRIEYDGRDSGSVTGSPGRAGKRDPRIESSGSDGGCHDTEGATTGSLSPEPVRAGQWDWALMRKFNAFWPTGGVPADFPWLADLVSREKAWRWASQFPSHFANLAPSSVDEIRRFISQTLTENDPQVADKKGCCKKKDKEVDLIDPCDCDAARAAAEASCNGDLTGWYCDEATCDFGYQCNTSPGGGWGGGIIEDMGP